MFSLHLVGEKSTVSIDVEAIPGCAFIEYRGRIYHRSDEDKSLWNMVEGELPKQANCYVYDGHRLLPMGGEDVAIPTPEPITEDAEDQPQAI